MKTEKMILDGDALLRSLRRVSHEIVENKDNFENLDKMIIVGIKRRGVPLAHIIADNIGKITGKDIPVAELDITLYRDDLSEIDSVPSVKGLNIDCDINGSILVLVDDVIYTGRTARAALDAVLDHGRPKLIELVEMVDRGHRELPIRADYVGKNIPTSKNEIVEVKLPHIDGTTGVFLLTDK